MSFLTAGGFVIYWYVCRFVCLYVFLSLACCLSVSICLCLSILSTLEWKDVFGPFMFQCVWEWLNEQPYQFQFWDFNTLWENNVFLRKIIENCPWKMGHLAPHFDQGVFTWQISCPIISKFSQDVQRCLKNTWVLLHLQNYPQIMSLELLNRPCRSSKRCVTLSPELLFCLLLKYLRLATKTWYQHFYSTSHNTVIRFPNRMECWFLYNEGKTDFV